MLAEDTQMLFVLIGLFHLLLLISHLNNLVTTTLEEPVSGRSIRMIVNGCGESWKRRVDILVGGVFASHEVDSCVVKVGSPD